MKNYYFGADIGTNSLGHAVTDENYNVLSAKSKKLWGVRLFDEAITAEERRVNRTARRRYHRKKARLKILEDLLAEELFKTDKEFLFRTKESPFTLKDKKCEGKFSLFKDKNYTDEHYHKEYPTIYHLRKMWIDSPEKITINSKPDIRLLYLALHDIFKNRGHFLLNIYSVSEAMDITDRLNELNQYLSEEFGIQFDYDKKDELQQVLKNKKFGKKQKENNIKLLNCFYFSNEEELEQTNKKQIEEIIKSIIGSKVTVATLFDNELLQEIEKPKFSFTDSNFDETYSKLESDLGEKIELINLLKAVYDWSVLVNIMDGSSTISEAKVKIYEQHKNDLDFLKRFVKTYFSEKEKEIFKISVANLSKTEQSELKVSEKKTNNYSAYSGMCMVNGKKVPVKSCSQDDFCDYLKKTFGIDEKQGAISCNASIQECDKTKFEEMARRVLNHTFMPKQKTSENSVIPYQINLEELKKILENASRIFDFLNEKDDNGLSVKEKLICTFEFKIPYYVGPLSSKNSQFAWSVRKESGKVYPWNFEQKIDVKKSSEKFITKMTNKCSYLFGEDVLPKNSIFYSQFTLLNELNNITINGERISQELKQKIYEELFLNQKRIVSTKTIKTLLNDKEAVVGGIDKTVKTTLNSYHDFKNLGFDVESNLDMLEDIVYHLTVFPDSPKLIKDWLDSTYGNCIDSQKIKKIANLKYSGWGRLSKKLLTDICDIDENGEVNIINMMKNTNKNFMELLSKNHLFSEKIDDFNNNIINEQKLSPNQMINELTISPSVKRSVNQTLLVLKDVVKVMGCPPKKLFIEMARGADGSGVKESRKKTLENLYKKIKGEDELFNELSSKSDNDLRRDKLFFYFTQKGKCMYCGKQIQLENLFTNEYDIDHIFPQSKIKDDSLDNRVLTCRTCNANKLDVYPLSYKTRKNQRVNWDILKSQGFISPKKHERLVRSKPFSDDELASFIGRQLVTTRQSTKAVAELIKQLYPETEIVYSKAGMVSEFRQEFDMLKCRDVNDLHHAKDAYLNIVVGNVYNEKFTKSPINFIKELSEEEKKRISVNIKTIFTHIQKKNDKIIWNGEKDIARIREIVNNSHNILFTRYSSCQKGVLFDVNPKPIINDEGIPRKNNKNENRYNYIKSYGAYLRPKSTYFSLIEYDGKKGRERIIFPVDLHLVKKYESSLDFALRIIEEKGLKNPQIIIPKIKYNALIDIDGFKGHISSKTGSKLALKPAMQLYLSYNQEVLIKKISSFVSRVNTVKSNDIEFDKKIDEMTKSFYHNLKEKFSQTQEDIENKFNNDILNIYDILLNKLKNSKYNVALKAQVAGMEKGRETFVNLPTYQKCIVFMQILSLFRCNVVTADLQLINMSKKAGLITINRKITSHVKLINQSPSGLFENEIDLLTCPPQKL